MNEKYIYIIKDDSRVVYVTDSLEDLEQIYKEYFEEFEQNNWFSKFDFYKYKLRDKTTIESYLDITKIFVEE